MNFYDIFMYPLEKGFLEALRKELIPAARGKILEIGAGTGVNFKYYDMYEIESITVLDHEINKTAEKRAGSKINFVESDAGNLPFEENSFDVVVETLLLCSVDHEHSVLSEIRRVLKPGGMFIHIDHGMPDRSGARKLFNFFAPAWRAMTRSCRINKEYEEMLREEGFTTENLLKKGGGVFSGGISYKKGGE
ncbi:MAG: methyltransferase domain-containing protein [Eubacteriales bacterium]